MTIHSIKINNLLSFECLEITGFKDMNCIIGKNNSGKSNLMKCLKFFYEKLEGIESLPPQLNSNYSTKGSISITYDVSKLFIISRNQKKNNNASEYFKFIERKLIPFSKRSIFSRNTYNDKTHHTLQLTIFSNNSIKWSTQDLQERNLILYLFPFFNIEPRHMELHEWNSLWDLISRVKSFNLSKIDNQSIVDFFNTKITSKSENSYSKYVNQLNGIIATKKSSQKEKLLSYIKSGLNGQRFEIDEKDLKIHSDGTNSYHFIKTFLKIAITISKNEYISPTIIIDEPEIGLHPKMNELLINEIHSCFSFGDEKSIILILNTHSQNIVKETIKSFKDRQSVFSFTKKNNEGTKVFKLKSTFEDEKFLNIFSDNESRLYFSNFILFVEGATEKEIFCNSKLHKHFPHLFNIDVYEGSNNTVSEQMNPYKSNSNTPFLFLFDADKAWNFDFEKNNITLKKYGNLINLEKTIISDSRKYSLGFSKKYRDLYSCIRKIKHIHESKNIKSNKTRQELCHIDINEFKDNINKYLLTKNIYINKTTIEGSLISIQSSEIFYNWLKDERNIDTKNIIELISRTKKFNHENLIDYFRVLFNGKSSLLSDYKSFNLKSYEDTVKNNQTIKAPQKRTTLRAKKIMKELEKRTISNNKIDKTDGWTSDFLNYAINHIEHESANKKTPFTKVFSLYFPELHDIISLLRPDS